MIFGLGFFRSAQLVICQSCSIKLQMNKFLILLIMMQASCTMLQAQSKKEQIEILVSKLDSVNRINSQSQSQIATMAIVLDRKKNENVRLMANIEELTRSNGLLEDSLQSMRFRMKALGHQVDSLKNYIHVMSKPVSDENLVKYISVDELCSSLDAAPIDQYFAMSNEQELGMTIRYHAGTKKVALITIGVSGCGDCGARYRFYFDNNNNLIREEYNEWCAVEGPGAVSLFTSTLIQDEYQENYRINTCYNATGPMIPAQLLAEITEAKRGYVAKDWSKIEATRVNSGEFLVFECVSM